MELRGTESRSWTFHQPSVIHDSSRIKKKESDPKTNVRFIVTVNSSFPYISLLHPSNVSDFFTTSRLYFLLDLGSLQSPVSCIDCGLEPVLGQYYDGDRGGGNRELRMVTWGLRS